MAEIVRLQTRPDRVKRETAAEIRQLILAYPEQDLPAQARAAILNTLTKATNPDERESIWPGGFVMINRVQTKAVWDGGPGSNGAENRFKDAGGGSDKRPLCQTIRTPV